MEKIYLENKFVPELIRGAISDKICLWFDDQIIIMYATSIP
jgi:hypothetical protein